MVAATRRSLVIFAVVCAVLIFAGPCEAQTADAADNAASSQRELVVGTKEAPPFAMKGADGN